MNSSTTTRKNLPQVSPQLLITTIIKAMFIMNHEQNQSQRGIIINYVQNACAIHRQIPILEILVTIIIVIIQVNS
jgi:hypothetical protein